MKGFINTNCELNSRLHTNVGECSQFEGTPKGYLFHDKDAVYSPDPETFNEELLASISPMDISRITPVMDVGTDLQVSGGDIRTNQEGYGPEVPNGLNSYREDWVITGGGFCLEKQLWKLNGKTVRVFKVDENDNAYGTIITVSNADRFRGFLVTVAVAPRTNTGSQSGAITLSLFYSRAYQSERENIASVHLEEEPVGLKGVVLKKVGTGTANLVLSCSADDLTSLYGEKLASPDLYQKQDGTSPTSVAYANGILTFTPSGTYRALGADVFEKAGIEGVEGEDIYTNLT